VYFHRFATQGIGPFAYEGQWGEQGLIYTTCRNGNGGSHHNAAQSARMTSVQADGLHLRLQRYSGNEFESAIIGTFASGLRFSNGFIEARIKYPRGTGYWPAFWLLVDGSGPRNEIDILEAYPNPTKWPFPNRHEMNTHSVVNGTDTVVNNVHDAGIDLTTGFHVFGLERRNGTIRAYLDGVLWKEQFNAPLGSMAILLDLKAGSFHSCTDSTTPNGDMIVEWIRMRQ